MSRAKGLHDTTGNTASVKMTHPESVQESGPEQVTHLEVEHGQTHGVRRSHTAWPKRGGASFRTAQRNLAKDTENWRKGRETLS